MSETSNALQPPEPIEKLLEDLQSTDTYRRKNAAQELGQRTPADQRTLHALATAAVRDMNKVVRSAAAKSYLDLTSAKLPQLSSETAATMTWAPAASSISRVLRSAGKLVLAAILSFVLNIVAVNGIVFAVNYSAGIESAAILVVLPTINFLVARYLARAKQTFVAAGIIVGLVCTLLAIGYVAIFGFVLLLGGSMRGL